MIILKSQTYFEKKRKEGRGKLWTLQQVWSNTIGIMLNANSNSRSSTTKSVMLLLFILQLLILYVINVKGGGGVRAAVPSSPVSNTINASAIATIPSSTTSNLASGTTVPQLNSSLSTPINSDINSPNLQYTLDPKDSSNLDPKTSSNFQYTTSASPSHANGSDQYPTIPSSSSVVNIPSGGHKSCSDPEYTPPSFKGGNSNWYPKYSCDNHTNQLESNDPDFHVPQNTTFNIPPIKLALSSLILAPGSSLSLFVNSSSLFTSVFITCFRPAGHLVLHINFHPSTQQRFTLLAWNHSDCNNRSTEDDEINNYPRYFQRTTSNSTNDNTTEEFNAITVVNDGSSSGCKSNDITTHYTKGSFAVLVTPTDECSSTTTTGDGDGDGTRNMKIIVGVVVGVVGGLVVVAIIAVIVGLVIWRAVESKKNSGKSHLVNI